MANYLPVVLDDNVRAWLTQQPPGSIHSWRQLNCMFCDFFKGTWKRPNPAYALNQLHQRKGELLRDFIMRFCEARTTTPTAMDEAVIVAFHNCVRDPGHWKQWARDPPTSVSQMFDEAHKFASSELIDH